VKPIDLAWEISAELTGVGRGTRRRKSAPGGELCGGSCGSRSRESEKASTV